MDMLISVYTNLEDVSTPEPAKNVILRGPQ
jgi:hypothetical protein